MPPKQPDEEAIFNVARRIGVGEGRTEYLDHVCGDDRSLRDRVEALLRVHDHERGFLEDPSPAPDATEVVPSMTEGPGTTVGQYKLLQQIGEGGFGVVYMADQKEPVKRRVALKIIKPGMDTRQVIARFEAERQALAMMDHPSIATVLDAGTTDSGRPYFVMELVKGVPITKYCDEHRLTPRERLKLFVPVCQAIQHAHQKGVIHRDIKPSNVLVGEYDNRAVPRIIDFGVAKAVQQPLTEKTMFTQFGQIVGTIDYMSPEQAKLNELDIDTRSDVYSLGVLLYELLTGKTPFDRKRLRSFALDEVLRIIREEEPPKPSLRLSTVESLPSIAANRHTEPKRLSTLVRGELDWIVMKALEKDRARRYKTANGFADDIQRYLDDEPVVACPPSATYRFRKFTRRHFRLLSVAVSFSLLLLAATVFCARQWILTDRARQQETEHRLNAEELTRAERAARAAAEQQRKEADQLAQRAIAQSLVIEAQRVSGSHPQKALLLAAEALAIGARYGGAPRGQARQTLYEILPFPDNGQTMHVADFKVSPDKHWVIASRRGTRDGSIVELWHRDAEWQHVDRVVAWMTHSPGLTFSDDSRWASAIVETGTTRLWDLADNPAKAYSLQLDRGVPREYRQEVSPNGRSFVIANNDSHSTSTVPVPYVFNLRVSPPQPVRPGLPKGRYWLSPRARWLIGHDRSELSLYDLNAQNPTDLVASAPVERLVGMSCFVGEDRFLATNGTNHILFDIEESGQFDRALHLERRDVEQQLPGPKRLPRFEGTTDGKWLVECSPNFSPYKRRQAPTDTDSAATASGLFLWDLDEGTHIALSPSGPICSMKSWQVSRSAQRLGSLHSDRGTVGFSSNNRWLAVAAQDNKINVWDLAQENITSSPTFTTRPESSIAYFQVTERWLLSCNSYERTVRVWDLENQNETGSPVVTFDRMSEGMLCGPNEGYLVAHERLNLRVWNLNADDMAAPSIDMRATGLIGPAAGWVFGEDENRDLHLWSLDSLPQLTGSVVGPRRPPRCAMSYDKRWCAGIVPGADVVLWDLQSGSVLDPPIHLKSAASQGRAGNRPKFWRDGRGLSLQEDGVLYCWNLEEIDRPRSISIPPGETRYAVREANEDWVLALAYPKDGTGEHSIQLWDLRDGATSPSIYTVHEELSGASSTTRLSASGRWLAVVVSDAELKLFDLNMKDPSIPARVVDLGGTLRQFDRDGKWLITDHKENGIWLYKLASAGEPEVCQLSEATDVFTCAAFSPDGRWLAVSQKTGDLHFWDLHASPAQEAFVVRRDDGQIRSLKFSPNGKSIASISHDGTVRVHEVASPAADSQVLFRGQNVVSALPEFSMDGNRLAIADVAGIRVWDLADSDPPSSLLVLPDTAATDYIAARTTIVFTSGDRSLVSSLLGSLRSWPLESSEVVRYARRLAGREFTEDERRQYLLLEQ